MSPDRPTNGEHPKEMISAYLDGQLEAPDRARVFEHLRDCDACRWLLSDYRALAAAARREAAPPVPADLAHRIGRRIDAEPATRFAWRRRLVTAARLPLATAAAVLVLASLWIVWRGRLPGERVAEPPAAVPAPESAPAPGLAKVPTTAPPAASSAPGVAAGGSGRVGSEAAGNVDAFGYAGGRHPAGWRKVGDEEASRPEARPGEAPPRVEPRLAAPRKDEPTAGGKLAQEEQQQEEQKVARLSIGKIPPPEENSPAGAAALEPAAERSESDVLTLAPGVTERVNMEAVTTAPTLVFVMPEGRVTILPGSQVVLTSGGYLCTVPATGQDDMAAIAELRALAARGIPPAGSPAAIATGRPGTPGEIVIPTPPDAGPLPPDLAAQLHLRLRTLLRERVLPRAEAQCGPAPPALRQIR
jgi:hypothetical protein